MFALEEPVFAERHSDVGTQSAQATVTWRTPGACSAIAAIRSLTMPALVCSKTNVRECSGPRTVLTRLFKGQG